MKNVIGFDSWTAGSHHFARLVPALRELGYQLLLIHIGSWGHDTQRPREEIIEGLLVRDVSYYGGQTFDEILALEQPSAVLFLSTRAFAHQAFKRYADQLGIPTVHLYHGLVNVQYFDPIKNSYRVSFLGQSRLIAERIRKNIFCLWPLYLRSLRRTQAPASSYYWFLRENYLKGTGGNRGVAPPDACTAAGCVYTRADISHMVRTYGVPRERVVAVGNPDLMRFPLTTDLIGCRFDPITGRDRWVVYIETAFIDAGLIFDGLEDFVKHLIETRDRLKEQGYRMTVKFKPHSTIMREGLTNRLIGLDICSDDAFLPRLKESAGAIVEPSTAAMIPALLGLPLLLACYGKLGGQRYGRILTSYPRALQLNDLSRFDELLEQIEQQVDRKPFERWVDDNAGPLPADQMPARVAAVIDDMARTRVGRRT